MAAPSITCRPRLLLSRSPPLGLPGPSLPCRVENRGTGVNGRTAGFASTARCGGQTRTRSASVEDLLQFAQVLNDQIRPGGAELIKPVISRQHRAGENTATPCGFDVMLQDRKSVV